MGGGLVHHRCGSNYKVVGHKHGRSRSGGLVEQVPGIGRQDDGVVVELSLRGAGNKNNEKIYILKVDLGRLTHLLRKYCFLSFC